MTYSICATDGRVHGVAIATKAPAVGGLAPFLSTNGAVCTQSFVNVPIGIKAAQLMDNEANVDDAIHSLLQKDDNEPVRQIHGIDCWGNSIVHSGTECVDWFGGSKGENYTVAGNMLTGEEVIDEIATTYESTTNQPMIDRLLQSIQAGEDAGGDKRAENAQSAAVKIYHPTEPRLYHDLRVDDHDDPVPELHRVYEVVKKDDEEWQDEYSESILQRNPGAP